MCVIWPGISLGNFVVNGPAWCLVGAAWKPVQSVCLSRLFLLTFTNDPFTCFYKWLFYLHLQMQGLAEPYIHLRCTYVFFCRESIRYKFIYGVYIQFWPTLQMTSMQVARLHGMETILIKAMTQKQAYTCLHGVERFLFCIKQDNVPAWYKTFHICINDTQAGVTVPAWYRKIPIFLPMTLKQNMCLHGVHNYLL